MQQLTKSFGSLSWALPLFGFQQMTNALRRSEDGTLGGDAVAAFDAVTRVSLEQCGTRVRETFEAGDKLQRDIVDTMFRLVPACGSEVPGSSSPGSCMPGMSDLMNPMQMMRRFTGRASDAAQPQAQAQQAQAQQAQAQRAQRPQSNESQIGWGPVPPVA